MGPTLEDAIAIAIDAHRGQTYPSPIPEPYILHPLRVMFGVGPGAAQVIAVLHDVIEDTQVTLRDLEASGFDSVVLEAIDRLTKRPNEAYEAYIGRVAEDALARKVKLSDLRDNLANNRTLPWTSDTVARITKYQQAITVLNVADANLA
jgi:(p)ppGpp synthase/HD superfamily hydrolase